MNLPPLHLRIVNKDSTIFNIKYYDVDSFNSLDSTKVKQVYGVCFYNDKVIIVHNGKKSTWGLVGGSMEKGETYEECLKREVLEESNMIVKVAQPIGYQEVVMGDKTIYQLRYVCEVKSAGNFVSDPAGTIDEIAMIDPKDYKNYFDWGEIGERIIKRAEEIKVKIDAESNYTH